jgi:hypothetical protein
MHIMDGSFLGSTERGAARAATNRGVVRHRRAAAQAVVTWCCGCVRVGGAEANELLCEKIKKKRGIFYVKRSAKS